MINLKGYIQQRYKEVAKELRPQLPFDAPKMVFTSGRTFWARIRKRVRDLKVNDYLDVRINYKLFESLYLREGQERFENKLHETICHELAHMIHWDHSINHKNLTTHFQNTATLVRLTDGQSLPTILTVAAEKTTPSTVFALADLVSDTKKARAALRKAGIQKPGAQWVWSNGIPEEVKKVLGV